MMRATQTSHLLRRVVLLLFVLRGSSTMAAQTPGEGSQTLGSALRPGMTAWITDLTGHEVKTQIVEVSPSIVVTDAEGGTRPIGTDEVLRIRVPKPDSMLDGALIGTGLGAAGLLGYCTWIHPCNYVTPRERLVFLAVGAGAGLAIDALTHGRQTIYDRRERSVCLDVAPILDRRTRGIQLTLGF